jgi:hypothetical protein
MTDSRTVWVRMIQALVLGMVLGLALHVGLSALLAPEPAGAGRPGAERHPAIPAHVLRS